LHGDADGGVGTPPSVRTRSCREAEPPTTTRGHWRTTDEGGDLDVVVDNRPRFGDAARAIVDEALIAVSVVAQRLARTSMTVAVCSPSTGIACIPLVGRRT
jgi:hypothetical protein